MKLTLEMPVVTECEARECAYNADAKCHARAITIGDGESPNCDTLIRQQGTVHLDEHLVAGVGACKVDDCIFNTDLECQAEGIVVGFSSGAVECQTYTTT